MTNRRKRAGKVHLEPFQELLRSVIVFLLKERATKSEVLSVMKVALAEAETIQRDSDALASLYVGLSRVIHCWHEDKRFLDSEAKPRPLHLRAGPGSLQELARVARVRVPYTRLLNSLTDQGLIRRVAANMYVPTKPLARLVGSGPEVTGYVGQSILQLIQTLESNRRSAKKRGGLLERAAIVDDLPSKEAAAFRRFSAEQGAAFIANANAWLEARRHQAPSRRTRERGITAGVHVFAFESSRRR